MKVLVSGSTGLVGSALVEALHERGDPVLRLVRPSSRRRGEETGIAWDPATGTVDIDAIDRHGGVDAVVHLAGDNLASGRWTPAKKASIRDSRVRGTRVLCEALSRLRPPPSTYVGASAIGYYGDRGTELLTETSAPGTGFLAEVCVAWEAATEPLSATPARVVVLRLGMVLSRAGGALAKMLTPFRLGLGGRVGRGDQYVSWIALDDVVSIILRALVDDSLSGPINTVAPNPVTNLDFARALGSALGRPAICPMPAVAARLAFGEMADELLLASTRVEPRVLQGKSFAFGYPALPSAFRHVLGK
jgi:uncharacterized protein (TIGR01777 family)